MAQVERRQRERRLAAGACANCTHHYNDHHEGRDACLVPQCDCSSFLVRAAKVDTPKKPRPRKAPARKKR